jgi:DNA-binding transcriptional ArsR family regulator
MPETQMLEAMSSFFKALGDQSRLRVLEALRERGEMGVSELVALLGRDQGRVSHHLACLRNCGLVKTRREGRYVLYSLNGKERVETILATADTHVRDVLEKILACEVVGRGG